jgi:hypothetical protein
VYNEGYMKKKEYPLPGGKRIRTSLFGVPAVLVVFGVSLGLPGTLFSLGGGETKDRPPVGERSRADREAEAPEGQQVEVSGRVRLVGSASFPELVLTDTRDRDWYIDGASREVLEAYEQRTVTVRGTLTLQKMILADGRVLETRRILTGLSLVEP